MKHFRIFLSIAIFFRLPILFASPVAWSYETQGDIAAGGITDDTAVYFGSADSCLYAVNLQDGHYYWKYKTGSSISSTPMLNDSAVFITSGNILYMINKKDGFLIWQYTPLALNGKTATFKKDQWDYHQSSPCEYKDKIYYGDEYGNIYGIDIASGDSVFHFTTDNKAFIRSTVAINNDTLYFGDWDGFVYAIDINSGSLIWTYRTYETLPYSSFGVINTQMLIYKNKLYFGSRNPDFIVLTADSGKVAWTYTAPVGGWVMGDPVIINDTLFVGTSDSRSMLAFNPENGSNYWEYKSKNNISCKPAGAGNMLLFGDGDSYNHIDGKGYFYLLDRSSGKAINIWYPGRNIYSPIIIKDHFAFFGCFDSSIYCLDINAFASADTSIIGFVIDPADTLLVEKNKTKSFPFSLNNIGDKIDSVYITFDPVTGIPESAISARTDNYLAIPGEAVQNNIKIKSTNVQSGFYDIYMNIETQLFPGRILTFHYILQVTESISSNRNAQTNQGCYYPNPADDRIYISLSEENEVATIEIYSITGEKMKTTLKQADGSMNTISINVSDLKSGLYIFKVTEAENQWSEKIIIQ